MSVQDKLGKKGPRKLLALDGGGIRGMISIEILARIEAILREQFKKPDLVLADYFDYIAGTSTGAIIATCLSLGMPVNDVATFYEASGKEMFQKSNWLDRYWLQKYGKDKLTNELKNVLGPTRTLGSAALRTLLMLVMRNATTDSPWPISNNPRAKYNCPPNRPGCNLELQLWQLVRASTAAPTFFPPEEVEIGPNKFIFVDGGMTMYNNPAFQLFLMATAEPYRLQWPVGEKEMLLVSVGTGTAAAANAALRAGEMNILYNASSIPSALMAAALHEQDFLCRALGRCIQDNDKIEEIDGEIGTMCAGDIRGTAGPCKDKLFTYVRYNVELTEAGLKDLGLDPLKTKPQDVQQLDSIDHIPDLQEVGKRVGQKRVSAAHFAGFKL